MSFLSASAFYFLSDGKLAMGCDILAAVTVRADGSVVSNLSDSLRRGLSLALQAHTTFAERLP